MNVTRKMWISAGVVGAVLVGGISVAAAAADGGIEKIDTVSQEIDGPWPDAAAAGKPRPAVAEDDRPPEDYVVSGDQPEPGKIGEHWTRRPAGGRAADADARGGPV